MRRGGKIADDEDDDSAAAVAAVDMIVVLCVTCTGDSTYSFSKLFEMEGGRVR